MRGANVGIAQEVLSRSTSLRRPSLRRQIGRAGNTSHCQIPSGHYGHEQHKILNHEAPRTVASRGDSNPCFSVWSQRRSIQ
jgi:hypothetical protein